MSLHPILEPALFSPDEIVETGWGKKYRIIEKLGTGGLAYIYTVEEVGVELPDDCTQEVQATRYALKVWKRAGKDHERVRKPIRRHELLKGLPEDSERVTVHEVDAEGFMALLSLPEPYQLPDHRRPIPNMKKLGDSLPDKGPERLLHAAKLLEHIFCVRRWAEKEGLHLLDLKEANLLPTGSEPVQFKGETYAIPERIVRTDFDFTYSDATLDLLFENARIRGSHGYIAPEQMQKLYAVYRAIHNLGNTPPDDIDVDYRINIFALGVCLYKLLSGTQLWQMSIVDLMSLLDEGGDSLRAEVKKRLNFLKKIYKREVTEANERELAMMLINMIGDMLSPEPQERDKVFHAIKAFQHKLQFVADLPAAA